VQRATFSSIGYALLLLGLPALSGGCCESCQKEKIYVDRYEHVKCTNCPPTKYVYHKAPAPPEKVVCVHRIKEPCPPQKVVHVNCPPPPQKVRYKYINEGSCCKTKTCPTKCEQRTVTVAERSYE
jgi:hypothetical protein